MKKAKYQFKYEWGETWEVTVDNFDWDNEYWFRIIARNIEYYRSHTTNTLEVITCCGLYRVVEDDCEYVGMISAGDHGAYLIFRGEDGEVANQKELDRDDFI